MNNEGYNVFRFTEHGGSCHIGTDYIEGSRLINYIKYHPSIEKDVLFAWIKEIEMLPQYFHKSRGEAYDYISPFSIIVAEDMSLHLADLECPENKPMRQKMERKSIKSQFYPEDENKRVTYEADNYSMAKTIQYILSVVEVFPEINKREEIKIKRIIKKALGKPEKTKVSVKMPSKRARQMTAAIAIVVLALGIKLFFTNGENPASEADAKALQEETLTTPEDKSTIVDKKTADGKETAGSIEAELRFHIGMLYLEELGEFDKAAEMFSTISDEMKAAEYYMDIAVYLGGDSNIAEEKMEDIIQKAEQVCPENEVVPIMTLLRSNTLLGNRSGYENVIRLSGETVVNEELLPELLVQRINAFEKLGRLKEAIEDILELIELESYTESKEEYYRKAAVIYNENGEHAKSYEILSSGMSKSPESIDLRILYLSYKLNEENKDIEKIKEDMKIFVRDIPEIKNTESFVKLCSENEINMEEL